MIHKLTKHFMMINMGARRYIINFKYQIHNWVSPIFEKKKQSAGPTRGTNCGKAPDIRLAMQTNFAHALLRQLIAIMALTDS